MNRNWIKDIIKAAALVVFLSLTSGVSANADLGVIDNGARTRTTKGMDGHTYVEMYSIAEGDFLWSFVPSTIPPGNPHYNAKVTLYRKDGQNLIKIGERNGQWIDGGCFEMQVAVPY